MSSPECLAPISLPLTFPPAGQLDADTVVHELGQVERVLAPGGHFLGGLGCFDGGRPKNNNGKECFFLPSLLPHPFVDTASSPITCHNEVKTEQGQ